MRGGMMSQMHNTRQLQDCVCEEGKEDERWMVLQLHTQGSLKIVCMEREKKVRGRTMSQMHNTRQPT